MRASAKLVQNVNLVRQVRLENVVPLPLIHTHIYFSNIAQALSCKPDLQVSSYVRSFIYNEMVGSMIKMYRKNGHTFLCLVY